jgi:hypothetical protein
MNTMLGTTRAPVVAVLLSSLLAACGVGPTEDAAAPSGGDVLAIEPGSTPAIARTTAAAAERDPAGPARTARGSGAAPGGACPSPADEPAPIDGGREVTAGPETEAVVQDLAPAPVQPGQDLTPPAAPGAPG